MTARHGKARFLRQRNHHASTLQVSQYFWSPGQGVRTDTNMLVMKISCSGEGTMSAETHQKPGLTWVAKETLTPRFSPRQALLFGTPKALRLAVTVAVTVTVLIRAGRFVLSPREKLLADRPSRCQSCLVFFFFNPSLITSQRLVYLRTWAILLKRLSLLLVKRLGALYPVYFIYNSTARCPPLSP